MRIVILVALLTVSGVACASEFPNIQGKWRATRYLQWGVRDKKVVRIADMKLRPENFGYMLFNPKQTLEIVIDKNIVPTDPEEQKANNIIKMTEMTGTMASDRKIMDPNCVKVPYLKTHVACSSTPGSKIPLKFSMVSFDSPSFDESRKLIRERFSKNGITDLQATVTTSNLSGESGGVMIMFVGSKHLLLNATYYARPVGVEQAQAMICPEGNECTATALLFDRSD
jgi:hypothetical protein